MAEAAGSGWTSTRSEKATLGSREISGGGAFICGNMIVILHHTHPHKKGPVMKNYARHLTSFPMVIYQAEHNLWCPVNVGWENFAQLQKFQVK